MQISTFLIVKRAFIESVMEPLRQRLTALKVVFEHITTKDAADYVRDGNERLAATITPAASDV
ncbi:dihydroorotase [Escherichia coli]|uniref:Dihydroorotase n=1 Tax=Escherichia coli TaxID=562 RepID=A0A376W3J4_ECOLX|nr:dihydroorotase [Escherichia coli]